MPISVNNTTITFNDATTQTTGFTNPIPVANGGTGGTTQATARAGIGAGTGNGNGNGNGNGFGNGNGNGTVTSVATGNGLQGGTITSTGTLSVACPTYNTVGSYSFVVGYRASGAASDYTAGSNYSVGSGNTQVRAGAVNTNAGGISNDFAVANISGTWKWMGATSFPLEVGSHLYAVGCRVS
jgi:hypothetical protein